MNLNVGELRRREQWKKHVSDEFVLGKKRDFHALKRHTPLT